MGGGSGVSYAGPHLTGVAVPYDGQMRYWSNDARAVRGTGCAARARVGGGAAGIDTGRLSVRFDHRRMVIKSTMF